MSTVKYLEVAFLQGDEATDVINLIEDTSEHTGLEHLIEYDFGVETELRAQIDGYRISGELLTFASDHTYSHGDYVLVYNTRRGYVALHRLIRIGDR